MTFIKNYKKGQLGENRGIPFGPGLAPFTKALNGLQKARYYGIASPPKTGKSTFINYAFIIQPYLFCLANNIPIEFIYYSLEMDRITQEFNFACYFLYHDYNITYITLPPGITKKGKNVIELDADYLLGKLLDDNDELIKVDEKIEELLFKIYPDRIIPLFGEYNDSNILTKRGAIIFITSTDNPTGVYKNLLKHAEANGKLIYTGEKGYERLTSYVENDSKKFTVVLIDHLRKLIPERQMQMKQTVDKMSEYSVILKNLINYNFVNVIHLNRSLTSVERFKQFGDELHPSSDDVKDSGNVAEDCDYLITMLNPNDTRYNLMKHFGAEIKDSKGNPLYPKLRTLHLVESRHCEFPQHFRVNMYGGWKNFEPLIIPNK
jgi:hypothetical protein